MADSTMVILTGLDGKSLTLEEAVVRPHLDGVAAPHLGWRLVRLIDSLFPLLDSTCQVANRSANAPILPAMSEFFEWLWADGAQVLRKKSWP